MKHDSDILKRIKLYFMRRKSAKEAHAFEREAERDSFLYEAMEGIEGMLTSDLQQAMDELDDRLDDKTSSRFVINWRIAASVLAFVSVAGLLYIVVSNNSSNTEEVIVNEQEEHYTPRTKQPSFENIDVPVREVKEDSIQSLVSEIEEGEPVVAVVESPKVPAMEKVTGKAEILDSKRKDTQVKTESNTSGAIAAADDEKESLFESDNSFATTESEEIRSVAMSSEKRQASPASVQSTPEGASKATPSKKSSEPKGGMAAYQSYLQKNIHTSQGMPKGSVTLTFELDRNGSPKKVVVANSLCTACDAEAIRLIENGPAWDGNGSKERISISVPFK